MEGLSGTVARPPARPGPGLAAGISGRPGPIWGGATFQSWISNGTTAMFEAYGVASNIAVVPFEIHD